MATWTADAAASTFPVHQPQAGAVGVAYGSYTWAAGATGPVQDDVIQFCKLPANAIVLDTILRAGDVDTGTETFDLDLGLSADADQFGNNGVFSGDAIAEVKPEVGVNIRGGGLLQSGGPQSVGTSGVTVIGTVIASPATFNASGVTISCTVFYTMPITNVNP